MTVPAPASTALPSYDQGACDTKLIGETIGRAFDRTVARFSEREALVVVHQGVRWTWRELAIRVESLAAGLLATGLAPGDRIGGGELHQGPLAAVGCPDAGQAQGLRSCGAVRHGGRESRPADQPTGCSCTPTVGTAPQNLPVILGLLRPSH
jgi:acyl-CoA synthetase (AMP-forming)/AMP-acid ligase II